VSESVRARLVSDEGLIPIEAINEDGVVLFGESSAWPRRTSLRINAVSPGTKAMLDNIRRDRGWGKNEIKLKYELKDGEIHLRGVDDESLPHGFWEVGFTAYDVISRRIEPVEIPEGGQAEVEVHVKNDVKRIAVHRESDWDPQIRRVLEASELDGVPGVQWARDDKTRANRRACVLNVLAVCRELGLIEAIEKLFFAEVDRFYAQVDSDLSKLLDDRFHDPKPPAHPIHQRLLNERPEEEREGYSLLSYRQARNPSMQVVTATPEGGGPFLAELDIDLGDVLDPLGFFIHTVEVLHPKRTDHLVDVRKRLEDTEARKYLAYDPA